ncbi:hypothetical protein [Mariniflexile sp.]|uniref:hypothetical protein n=1 Tax=Mariniflexile sp. TaxID=1979402 RepID=UPI0040488F3A
MKKYSITILYMILIVITTSAQGNLTADCSADKLKLLPGTWKKATQGSIENVSAIELAKEKTILNNLHQLISDNYKPTGCQISYSTVFGKYPIQGKNWIADPYYYSMYILRYLCDKNSGDKSKYYVDVSTTTNYKIAINAIYNLNRLYAAELPDDELRGYLKLKQKPQKKDGFYFMGEEIVGDAYRENKIIQYSWLITYNDTLPFYYVSRKEYLQLTKKRLDKTMSEQPESKAYYQEFAIRIKDHMNQTADYLNQPAICMWNDEERFNGFVEEGTLGSFIAIKPNIGYYRKNLKPSVPQFFHIQYELTQREPVFEKNIDGIKEAVDFEKLHSMLGKEPIKTSTKTTNPLPKNN